ncbi:hypothetical protein ACHAPJ_011725 [Fusarium lateritium]
MSARQSLLFRLLFAWMLLLAQCLYPSQAAGLLKRADTGRTVAPANCIVAKPSGAGNGEFTSLQAAVNSIGSSSNSACIFLNPGTYNERVDIKINAPLTLYGSTAESNNFAAYNINFVNGYTDGQAVALTANGNKTGFYGCSFKSRQDTLYAKNGWMYYSNCYIEGAVNYIFGNGHAWFGECTIASNGRGYITATSRTEPDDTSRYIIDHSTITSTGSEDLTGKGFLGRPWRVNARVMYQYSTLTEVVNPEGYAPMAEEATPIFQEYGNTGKGADTSKRKYFTPADSALTKKDLWGSGYGWYDSSY